MKRLLVLLLIIPCLIGCSSTKIQKPASFYYPPVDYIYAQNGSFLDFEVRETVDCLNVGNMLELYMKGPENHRFINPFPSNCKILSLQHYGSKVELVISNEFAALNGISLPIACASLAKTCMELTGAEIITIRTKSQPLGGSKQIVLTEDTLHISSGIFTVETND